MKQKHNLWRKLVGLLVTIILTINLVPVIGNAQEIYFNELSETELIELDEKFDLMSIDDLNETIDNIANFSKKIRGTSVPTGNVQQAWLAAAKIAKKKGYPCAASLVEYSVKNSPCIESSNGQGLCGKKIIKTNVYKKYLAQAKRDKKSTSGSFAFTKNEDSDLFYALHNVNYKIKRGVEDSQHKAPYFVTITDTFDFAYDNNYDSLFTTAVNNWAWLCQQTHVLHKIPVTIDISFQ